SDLSEGMAIRRNDEITVDWTMDESNIIRCDLNIPSVSQIFKGKYFAPQAGHQAFHGEEGQQLVSALLDDAEDHLAEAEGAIGKNVPRDLEKARSRLDAQRQQLANGADAEQRRGISEEARRIRQDLARLCNTVDARQAILGQAIRDIQKRFDTYVR